MLIVTGSADFLVPPESAHLQASPVEFTLPESNMETQKGAYKDYSPFKRGLFGFPC